MWRICKVSHSNITKAPGMSGGFFLFLLSDDILEFSNFMLHGVTIEDSWCVRWLTFNNVKSFKQRQYLFFG